MQFFKVNCFKTVGNATEPEVHYVTATAESDAIAAIVADASATGNSCSGWQVIPLQANVMVGN